MRLFLNFIMIFLLAKPFAGCSQNGNDSLLKKAENSLRSGQNISALLSNPQFDSIRPETSFRELIKQHSAAGVVTMVTNNEPGTKITVRGQLKDVNGNSLKDHLVYVYQTNYRGWYGSDRVHFNMMSGDERHARLFAYLKTDAQGKFEFNTIQPQGYPQSDLPAHIHIEVFDKNRSVFISELLFDDDDRLVGERRTRSISAGFMISKPSMENGKKVYDYTVTISR